MLGVDDEAVGSRLSVLRPGAKPEERNEAALCVSAPGGGKPPRAPSAQVCSPGRAPARCTASKTTKTWASTGGA
eukprot:12220612-Alexandrium_andersonii.AAC.1